jgi:anti-sigma B factor antagonist
MSPSTTMLTEPESPTAVPWHGATVVIEVDGELDLLTAPRLRDLVAMVLERQPPVLVIDLLAVTFLGVSGLATLIDARQWAGERTRLRVVVAGPTTRLLRLTGMDRHLTICPTLADALDVVSAGEA